MRWTGVANGRYEKYHPITDSNKSVVGYLIGGVTQIGYTYHSLFSNQGGCFIISHVPFGEVWGNHVGQNSSYISFVQATGEFWLFRKGLKFTITSSINFPKDWVGSELVYRLIGDGRTFLCVTRLGFCLINVLNQSVSIKQLFVDGEKVKGGGLSPNGRILVIITSKWQYSDPIKGD